jgi:uncharacterized protein
MPPGNHLGTIRWQWQHKRRDKENAMSREDGHVVDLRDDTRLNVASLLMEPVGNTRDVELHLTALPLDDDLVARDVEMLARLTRLRGQILVSGTIQGHVQLECVRCLSEYDQPFEEEFSEQFFQTVDVRTGVGLTPETGTGVEADDEDELRFSIDENHQLDLRESLRQWILLVLPMRPDCGENCAGPLLLSTANGAKVDDRFAGLADLLDDIESE